MPMRKSHKQAWQKAKFGQVTPEALSSVPVMEVTSSKAPWRLSMYVPNRPVDGLEDEFIHTRTVSADGAVEIVEKYGDRVYIVGEEIYSNLYPWGRPLDSMARLLIAMEVVPVGGVVLSFEKLEQVEGQLSELVGLGAHVLNTKIGDPDSETSNTLLETGKAEETEKTEEVGAEAGQSPAFIRGVVNDMLFQYDWAGGGVPKKISDWINLRFYALSVLNCCYIGRGAPAGVNLQEQAELMASDTELLRKFVEAITSGERTLPEGMENKKLPAWQEKILWNNRIDSHYQKALKQSENFREFFYFAPYVAGDNEDGSARALSIADEEFRNIKELMRQMIYAYEKGEENDIPDVIWTESGPEQMAEALDDLGIVSSIDAYLSGVPFEDVVA